MRGTTTLTLAGSGSAYTVTVTTGTGNGTLGVNMPTTATVIDAAGNTLLGLPVTGPIFTIDRSAPTFTGLTLSPTAILPGTASVNATPTGAADTGGSGVAGGEWWIGTANIAVGTGTAFTGPTATVDTSGLAAGTYTVRVRIRDAAGNWSAGGTGTGVQIATLDVVQAVADAKHVCRHRTNGVQTQSYNSNATVCGSTTSRRTAYGTRVCASRTGQRTGTAIARPGAGPRRWREHSRVPGCRWQHDLHQRQVPCDAAGDRRQLTLRKSLAKQGTYTFTYTETLDGVTSPPATVTITVN